MGVLSEFAPASVFIETGLGSGQSLRAALLQPFLRLESIEIDESLILRFLAQTPALAHDSRLRIHLGSSPVVLPRLIDPTQSTMFWLDAHYSAGLYTSNAEADLAILDSDYGQCPLLAELAVIRSIPWTSRPWIYIDDVVCFDAPRYEGMWRPYDRTQFPSVAAIAEALPPDYRLDRIDMAGAAFRATPLER